MNTKSCLLAAALVLVTVCGYATVEFMDPEENFEYDDDANVSVHASTNVPACAGKTASVKLRDGHVSGTTESGTIYQSESTTCDEEERQIVVTLPNPPGGWPSSPNGTTPVHVEVKIALDGADEVGSVNVYIAQEEM